MDLPGNTTTLLATGVVGIVEFLFTIPAVLWVDQIGRKKILIAGAAGMATCHFIVAGIIGSYQGEFGSHRAAGWTGIVFVWIFVINFAYSWGPVAWIVTSEVFPLSMRAKGVSIGGSSNWVSSSIRDRPVISNPSLVEQLRGRYSYIPIHRKVRLRHVHLLRLYHRHRHRVRHFHGPGDQGPHPGRDG